MSYQKKPPFRKTRKEDINKEVIEHIKDTKRKMKKKIPQSSSKTDKKETQ